MFVKNKPPKNYSFAAIDETNFIREYFFCQQPFFTITFCPSYVSKKIYAVLFTILINFFRSKKLH